MYVLRRENGDVIYFDAVTSIEESYTSTVTKHPVATGGYISDHTIKDNKKFTLSAVLSDADFNLDRPSLTGNDPRLVESQLSYSNYELNPETGLYDILKPPKTQQKQYQNNTPTNTTVTIKDNTTGSTLKKFLPEVVSQFTKDTIPTVEVTAQNKVKTALAVRDELISMWENKENFTLMEYDGNVVSRYWDNMVFTRLSFAQDADSGLGLFPQMAFEKVHYTDIEKVRVTVRVNKGVNNKGRKSGEVTKKPTEEGDDSQNQPTNLSKKSALKRLQENAQENSEAQGV